MQTFVLPKLLPQPILGALIYSDVSFPIDIPTGPLRASKLSKFAFTQYVNVEASYRALKAWCPFLERIFLRNLYAACELCVEAGMMKKTNGDIDSACLHLEGWSVINFTFASKLPDDRLYASSPELRRFFPRGCGFLLNREGIVEKGFFGILKFSSLSKEHDDDRASSSKDSIREDTFLKGAATDVKYVVLSDKANGKNAKFGVFFLGGVKYLWAGSKMTVHIMLADVKPTTADGRPLCGLTAATCAKYPGQSIARMWWSYYNDLSDEVRTRLDDLFRSGRIRTLLGEAMLPWSQHLVRAYRPHVLLYTALGHDMQCVPHTVFGEIASSLVLQARSDELDLRGPLFMKVAEDRLDGSWKSFEDIQLNICSVLGEKHITSECKSEGVVAYMYSRAGVLFGLVKVKTEQYICFRRLREALRAYLRALLRKKKTKKSPLETFRDSCGRCVNPKLGCAFARFIEGQAIDSLRKYFDRSDSRLQWVDLVDLFLSNKDELYRQMKADHESILQQIKELKNKAVATDSIERKKIGKQITALKKGVKTLHRFFRTV